MEYKSEQQRHRVELATKIARDPNANEETARMCGVGAHQLTSEEKAMVRTRCRELAEEDRAKNGEPEPRTALDMSAIPDLSKLTREERAARARAVGIDPRLVGGR